MTETGLDLWVWTVAGICIALIAFALVCVWVCYRNTCEHGIAQRDKCPECALRIQQRLEAEPLRVMWEDEK